MRISDWSSDVCSSDLTDLIGEPCRCHARQLQSASTLEIVLITGRLLWIIPSFLIFLKLGEELVQPISRDTIHEKDPTSFVCALLASPHHLTRLPTPNTQEHHVGKQWNSTYKPRSHPK